MKLQKDPTIGNNEASQKDTNNPSKQLEPEQPIKNGKVSRTLSWKSAESSEAGVSSLRRDARPDSAHSSQSSEHKKDAMELQKDRTVEKNIDPPKETTIPSEKSKIAKTRVGGAENKLARRPFSGKRWRYSKRCVKGRYWSSEKTLESKKSGRIETGTKCRYKCRGYK